MIDLHSHILPGVDDGARTLAESVDIARAAAAAGTRILAATPHVREDYPTSAETVERLVVELQRTVRAAGIALELRPGGEVAIDKLAELEATELRRFGLGGNPSYLLVEFPYYGWPLDLGERIFRLRGAGITAVIAHPERNSEVQVAPHRMEPLVRAGALVQLTGASVDGRLGKRPRTAARALLDLRCAHLVASDAHSPDVRGVALAPAVDALADSALAEWLVASVPAAIVAGTPLPPRPESRARRRHWRFRRAV